MKIVAICQPNSAPCYHRLYWPLCATGEDVYITNYLSEADVKDADIVISNRHFYHNTLEEVLAWKKKYGFKIVIDLDDYWVLGASHILSPFWEMNNTTGKILDCINNADYVFCSTQALLNHVKNINPECSVLPNAIQYGYNQFLNAKGKGEAVKLFWAGGVTHDKDIELLRNPIKRIHAEFKDICMVMAGYQPDAPVWHKMASAFTNGKKTDRIILNMMPIEEYYQAYQLCDISIIPLIENTFNTCKSNLKILEAAGVNAPVVVSNTGPYRGFPTHLVNYVNNQSDWYLNIKYLLKNPNKIKDQGEALNEYCKTYYNFDEINKKRVEILKHVTGK